MSDKILKARIEASFTQEALAKKIGVSASTISSWETGKSKPSDKEIEKLNKVLDTDLNKIELSLTTKGVLNVLFIIILLVVPGIYLINETKQAISSYNIMMNVGETFSKTMLNDYSSSIIKGLVIMYGWYTISNVANYIFFTIRNKKALFTTLFIETIIFGISIVSSNNFDITLSLLCIVPVITGFFEYLYIKK